MATPLGSIRSVSNFLFNERIILGRKEEDKVNGF